MHSAEFSTAMQFSGRHRAGADPGSLGDRLRRTPGGSLPGAATDHAQLQHAGQHAQAVGDDGRRHPLPRLAARIRQRADCSRAMRRRVAPAPVETRREAAARPAAAPSRCIAPEPRARRPNRSPSPRSRRAGACRQGRDRRPVAAPAPSPSRRRSGCSLHRAARVAAPSDRRAAARASDPSGRASRARRTPRARPKSATSFAKSSPANSSTAWSRASPIAKRSSRSIRRAATSSRCGFAGRAERARQGRDRISAHASTPTASIRRTTACRSSTSAAPRRRPKPS